MITFRNELWDDLVRFIGKFADVEKFKELNEGKFKKRLQDIYNRAVSRMRIDKTDITLIADTFKYLNEKDIPSDLVDQMNECEVLGLSCTSTKNGERIIKECAESLERKAKEKKLQEEMGEAERILKEREMEHENYVSQQTETEKKLEEAKAKLEKIRIEMKKVNELKSYEQSGQTQIGQEEINDKK